MTHARHHDIPGTVDQTRKSDVINVQDTQPITVSSQPNIVSMSSALHNGNALEWGRK